MAEGTDVISIDRGGAQIVLCTVLPRPEDDFATLLLRLQRVLAEREAELLELKVFAPVAAYPAFREAHGRVKGGGDWPVTFVDGRGCAGGGVAGLQAQAVAGATVGTVFSGAGATGRMFEDAAARYCVLGDVRPPVASGARPDQVRDALDQLEAALDRAGMDLRDVVRTWFYIDDILDWYGDFNAVRCEVYGARGIFERFVPASTGIGGRNVYGAALVAAALAVQPKGGEATVREIASPLQCPAGDYGSSFSRAAELATPGRRWLTVSGTASIDAEGRTLHAGDVAAQIDRTLAVAGAILESRGMGFGDVVRANAYFRHAPDAAALAAPLERYGLAASRVVVSNQAVCRDELLFELEADAVTGGDAAAGPDGRAGRPGKEMDS